MHLYPLGTEAYAAELLRCEAAFYAGHPFVCTTFVLWHMLLHLCAAALLVVGLHLISKRSTSAAYIIVVFYVCWFLFQELVDQPVRIHQPYTKAWIDLATWYTPLLVWYWFERKYTK